jgi:hypothetical protein
MASKTMSPSLSPLSLTLSLSRRIFLVPAFSGAYLYFSYSLISPTNGHCSGDRRKAGLNVETLLCLIMASPHLSLGLRHKTFYSRKYWCSTVAQWQSTRLVISRSKVQIMPLLPGERR